MKFLLILILLLFPFSSYAEDGFFKSTELEIPRFVTLKSGKVYSRSGPGKQYPVEIEYQRVGLPVEITLEYETWRKIRDVDGEEGWVHGSLLSGKRGAIIKSFNNVSLLEKPEDGAPVLVSLEPGVVTELSRCKEAYCELKIAGYKGWVPRSDIWGAYEDEEF